jgi:hypothetical protein
MQKELKKLNTKEANNPINKQANELDIFQRNKYKWPKKLYEKILNILSYKGNYKSK